MGVNGEALQLRTVYKKPYFLLQVMRQSVSVLQVTRESVSGTTSHARIRIRYLFVAVGIVTRAAHS